MGRAKPNLTPDVTPHPSQCLGECIWRVCHVGKARTRENHTPNWGAKIRGEGGVIAVWYNLRTGWWIPAKFGTEMANAILFISYLDKICLTLTGNLWRALACLYSEARLYTGPREATRPQWTTLHSTGNISMWTKEVGHSNPRGTVRLWSFPLKFTAAQ